jgi:AcrR family transcriptional regulator
MNASAPQKKIQARVAPRDRILAHAIELFAIHGFEAMTMRLLGDAVGLDNSSLYRHFKSKTELVNAVLDHVAAEVLSKTAPRIDLSQPITLRMLEDACAAAALHFFDRPSSARLMLHWIMSMGADRPEFVVSVPATDKSRPGGALLGILVEGLEGGVRHGTLRKHAVPEAVVILLGAILMRPATYGHLLASMEPKRARTTARRAWEEELRSVIRGAFAP